MEPWFCGRKSSLSEMSKKFLTEQLSQHVKLLQLKKWFGFFFFSQSAAKQKPPLSLICLGRVPLGGGSAWTERALPEDYRMRGGEMSECVCVGGVYICVWWAWGCGGGVGFGGVASNFSQNAAIVPKIEQRRAVTLIFQSIHYLLCIYLSLSHKEKNQC